MKRNPTIWRPIVTSFGTPGGALLGLGVALLSLTGAVLVCVAQESRNLLLVELSGDVATIRALAGHDNAVALAWNLLLLGGVTVAIVVAGLVGREVFVREQAKRAAGFAVGAGILAAVAALTADLATARVLSASDGDGLLRPARLVWIAQGSAFVVVILLLFGVAVAATVTATTIWRVARNVWPGRPLTIAADAFLCGSDGHSRYSDRSEAGGGQPADPEHHERFGTAEPTDLADASRAGPSGWIANSYVPPGRELGKLGICVSGGGIRSAVFSLGALQVLQERHVLAKARYLFSVSGGGYAAGAMRLALGRFIPCESEESGREESGRTGQDDQAPPQQRPRREERRQGTAHPVAPNVFADGSAEFHHVRCRSKYLAEGVGQWLTALGVVLRGLLVAQLTLLVTVILAGRLLGQVYAMVPPLKNLLPQSGPPLKSLIPRSGGTAPSTGVVGAVVTVFVLAASLWLLCLWLQDYGRTAQWAPKLKVAAKGLGSLGLVMVVITMLVPALAWASQWAVDQYQKPATPNAPKSTVTATAGVLLTTYVTTLTSIFLATRKIAGPVVGWMRSNRSWLRALSTALVQRVLVLVGVIVLLGAHLFVFARILVDTTAAHGQEGDNWPGFLQQWYFWVALVLFLLLSSFIDQTRWSLHPFYKRRLMTAFAVRRVESAEDIPAKEYAFDTELTALDTYCSHVPGFPQVVFVAAASVSGQTLTPPGRRVLPYTLSGDWVGSPRLGWIRPAEAHEVVSRPFRRDLTTQGAMAVSGAAFASAMGASGGPFSLLFALTNARLGTWLPNPYFLNKHSRDNPQSHATPSWQYLGRETDCRWKVPRPPRRRRLSYLLREIFGIYPKDGQLLLVTDGGHYDNLGLVELLRHFPSRAYCFDASGGPDLSAGALGPAIALAHEELGITVELHEPHDVEPGSYQPSPDIGPGQETAWTQRLANTCVLTGTIRYPESRPSGIPEHAELYFGKAVLTSDSPWEVQAYARQHPAFPNDNISDQWFDHAQFDAYHTLGRHVGRRLLARVGDDRG